MSRGKRKQLTEMEGGKRNGDKHKEGKRREGQVADRVQAES